LKTEETAKVPLHNDLTVQELTPYAGRWIAIVDKRVVAQGGTPQQALHAAKLMRLKEVPQVIYVPTQQPLKFSSHLARVCEAIPNRIPVYLVGGAVRDSFLSRLSHDLDFALRVDALGVGRQVADALGGAYYPLDEERETGRVILTEEDGSRMVLDFALFRGPDLESDLRARDFTVNAMAVDVRKIDSLLDPLGGLNDLLAKQLRACTSGTFDDDPVRILRGVRLAADFGFRIHPETIHLMRISAAQLERVSPERIRDELFRILGGPRPGPSVQALDMLGVLPYLLPELLDLKGVTQSPPHTADVWTHTISVMRNLNTVLNVISSEFNPDESANLAMGMLSARLGRYRQQVAEHLDTAFTPDRSLRPLLFLAALFHDIGKPETRQVDEDGRIRFFEHEQVGVKKISNQSINLHLSNEETKRLTTILLHHMRPILLAQSEQGLSRKAVYRFFRDTKAAGIDICLLSLADVLGTYGPTLPQNVWRRHLDVVRTLFDAWWDLPEETVSPPPLLNGRDLIKEFDLKPGPQIGSLLEALREAQVVGQISDRDTALEFVRQRIELLDPDE
jgi:putative nucleotidyltransferase with HDIG domain